MWFNSPLPWLPEYGGLPLLAVSCVVLIAALHVWVVRGTAPRWLWFGTLIGVIALIVSIAAPELLLFMAGHLVGLLAVRGIASAHRVRQLGAGLARRKWDAVGLFAVLGAECLLVVTRADFIYPWHWLAMGAGTGAAAAVIDMGITCRRWWLVWSIATAVIAISIACVTGGTAGRPDLFFGHEIKLGEVHKPFFPKPWFSFGILAAGTTFYWFWRVAGRLARAVEKPEGPSRYARLGVLLPARGANAWWGSLGNGYRRWLRLIFVWPILIGLSVFVFTPSFEVWWRLPLVPEIPPQPIGENAYDELIAFPDRLDWSMAPSRRLDDRTLLVLKRFYEANRATILELEAILKRPTWSPINYSPLASILTAREIESIRATKAALFMVHMQAMHSWDFETQYVMPRIMLLMARPFRRGGLLRHKGYARGIERQGFAMTYQARTKLNVIQCNALTELIRESAELVEANELVEKRHADWDLIAWGWRERVKRSCYPDGYFDFSYNDDFEQEHHAYRRTLLCDLALRQYEFEHDLESPESLDDLVPKYLTAVPLDPYGGEKLRYDQTRDPHPMPYTYSIGYNRKDDGGVPDKQFGVTQEDDISIARYAIDWLREATERWLASLDDPSFDGDDDLLLPDLSGTDREQNESIDPDAPNRRETSEDLPESSGSQTPLRDPPPE